MATKHSASDKHVRAWATVPWQSSHSAGMGYIVGSRQARSGCYGHFKFGVRNFLQHACPPRAILLQTMFSYVIQRTE